MLFLLLLWTNKPFLNSSQSLVTNQLLKELILARDKIVSSEILTISLIHLHKYSSEILFNIFRMTTHSHQWREILLTLVSHLLSFSLTIYKVLDWTKWRVIPVKIKFYKDLIWCRTLRKSLESSMVSLKLIASLLKIRLMCHLKRRKTKSWARRMKIILLRLGCHQSSLKETNRNHMNKSSLIRIKWVNFLSRT